MRRDYTEKVPVSGEVLRSPKGEVEWKTSRRSDCCRGPRHRPGREGLVEPDVTTGVGLSPFSVGVVIGAHGSRVRGRPAGVPTVRKERIAATPRGFPSVLGVETTPKRQGVDTLGVSRRPASKGGAGRSSVWSEAWGDDKVPPPLLGPLGYRTYGCRSHRTATVSRVPVREAGDAGARRGWGHGRKVGPQEGPGRRRWVSCDPINTTGSMMDCVDWWSGPTAGCVGGPDPGGRGRNTQFTHTPTVRTHGARLGRPAGSQGSYGVVSPPDQGGSQDPLGQGWCTVYPGQCTQSPHAHEEFYSKVVQEGGALQPG